MRFSFLIIDDNASNAKKTLELFENFPNYFCAGIAKDNQMAINQIIKLKPQLVLVQIPAKPEERTVLFKTISELFQYVESLPYFVALGASSNYAFEAIQSGFSDYIVESLQLHDLVKLIFKF
jgi:DNA-binding NarL/FixJ family response regulator